jgi:outer membrane receptor protein involved in Fe transport
MNYEFGSAVGGPLVTDKVAIRASAYYRHDGGYIDRVDYITGTLKDKNSNAMDSYVLRGALTLAPTEELKITGTLFYQKTRSDDASVMWRVLSDRENGKFLSGQRQPSTDRDEILLPSLKMEYNGDGFDIVTNTSYMIRDNDPSVDYSTTVPGIFAGSAYLAAFPNYEATAELQNRYRSFVQEARIQSAGDQKLRWVAGLYYNRLKQAAAEQIIDGQFGDLIEYIFEAPFVDVTSMDLIDGKYSYIQDFRTKSTELAAFVDLNYEIVPSVRVSVGARVSQNKYESKNYVTGPFNFGTGNSATQIEETPFTPKFGVNWQIDDRNMVYATAAKGYRTGGGNIVFDNPACAADLASRGYTSVPETYKSDHLWSYEVGTKNRIGSLQIAASAFHIKWNSIQQNVMLNNCGLQFTDNLGTATSDGFDLQLSKKFGDLLLSAQVGYTNSRYSETVALSDDENILPIVRKGNALQQQPWSFTISGQYDFNLVEMPSFVRVDYNNLSGRRTIAAQDQETSTFDPNRLGSEPYSVLNARVGMNVSDVELSVFANNILNASPRLSSLSEGGTLYLKETTLRPRAIGLNASYRY